MLSLTSKQQAGLREIARLAREGAKLRPQAYYSYIKEGATCFIGATVEAKCGAISNLVAESVWYNLMFDYDMSVQTGLIRFPFPPNDKGYSDGTLFCVVATLNDTFGWTREKIADYLDKLADEAEVTDAVNS